MTNLKNKKIAIIGSGIAGLGFAYIAQKNNLDITLLEKNDYFGGHSNTIDLKINDKTIPIDTGFLVHNKVTYPNLIQLFELLAIDIVDSDMSLSIKVEDYDFEWGGTNLNTVFGQRSNLINPSYYFFLKEILRFNKESTQYLDWAKEDHNRTLDELLTTFGYSSKIKEWYIIPMAAAIWSTPANKILSFPAHTFLTFSINHHLLQVDNRPIWRTIRNGSRNYVQKITSLIDKKRLNTTVKNVEFREGKNYIETESEVLEFDIVIYAGHADDTLSLISNPTIPMQDILGSFSYETNIAHVHSDVSLLPKRERLWSAWNYVSSKEKGLVTVSYLINKLQPLDTHTPIIVTLNPHIDIPEAKTYRKINYSHPLFDSKAIKSQSRLDEIQGANNSYFIGAWTGYGFHEDGLKSAVRVAKKLNIEVPWNAVL
jgi:predicted NAD/FAD-binding protein